MGWTGESVSIASRDEVEIVVELASHEGDRFGIVCGLTCIVIVGGMLPNL